jgi:hypothetical protein
MCDAGLSLPSCYVSSITLFWGDFYSIKSVFQVIAHWLWHHLSVGGSLEARSVALFQQLHDTVAADDVVEATIGEFITQDDDEAQLKGFHTFATLWHATREITKKGKRPFVK